MKTKGFLKRAAALLLVVVLSGCPVLSVQAQSGEMDKEAQYQRLYAVSATASSEGYPATNAFDGHYDTYWHADQNSFGVKWVMGDFGKTSWIRYITVTFYNKISNGAADFEVQVSNDPLFSNYTVVKTFKSNAKERVTMDADVTGRYVRLYCTRGSTAAYYAPSVREIMVYTERDNARKVPTAEGDKMTYHNPLADEYTWYSGIARVNRYSLTMGRFRFSGGGELGAGSTPAMGDGIGMYFTAKAGDGNYMTYKLKDAYPYFGNVADDIPVVQTTKVEVGAAGPVIYASCDAFDLTLYGYGDLDRSGFTYDICIRNKTDQSISVIPHYWINEYDVQTYGFKNGAGTARSNMLYDAGTKIVSMNSGAFSGTYTFSAYPALAVGLQEKGTEAASSFSASTGLSSWNTNLNNKMGTKKSAVISLGDEVLSVAGGKDVSMRFYIAFSQTQKASNTLVQELSADEKAEEHYIDTVTEVWEKSKITLPEKDMAFAFNYTKQQQWALYQLSKQDQLNGQIKEGVGLIAGYRHFEVWDRDASVGALSYLSDTSILEDYLKFVKAYPDTKNKGNIFMIYTLDAMLPNKMVSGDWGGDPPGDYDGFFIEAIYSLYKQTHDIEVLRTYVPVAEGLIDFLVSKYDKDHDYLIEGISNECPDTYHPMSGDVESSIKNAAILRGYELLAHMETLLGNTDKATKYQGYYDQGSANYIKYFWRSSLGKNGGWRMYQTYNTHTGSDVLHIGSYANALCYGIGGKEYATKMIEELKREEWLTPDGLIRTIPNYDTGYWGDYGTYWNGQPWYVTNNMLMAGMLDYGGEVDWVWERIMDQTRVMFLDLNNPALPETATDLGGGPYNFSNYWRTNVLTKIVGLNHSEQYFELTPQLPTAWEGQTVTVENFLYHDGTIDCSLTKKGDSVEYSFAVDFKEKGNRLLSIADENGKTVQTVELVNGDAASFTLKNNQRYVLSVSVTGGVGSANGSIWLWIGIGAGVLVLAAIGVVVVVLTLKKKKSVKQDA